jgi:hypothetical protein
MPNFIFNDDLITVPYKNVESSDSATLSDKIFVAFESFDSLIAEEFINIFVQGPHDHLYINDDIKSISLESSDSGEIQEIVIISLSVEDSIILSEFIENISLAVAEENHFIDIVSNISTFIDTFDLDQTYIEFSGFITADGPGLDHMHWNDDFDYQFIATTLSTVDDLIVSESIPDIAIPVVDASSVSEFISLSLVGIDALSVVDVISSIETTASSQDNFIYEEFFELLADLVSTDEFTETEFSSIEANAIGLQEIAFEEKVSIEVSVSDSSNLVEIIKNSLNNSDSINFAEEENISLNQLDSIILSDLSLISADISNNDASSLFESRKEISLSSKQEFLLSENIFYHVDYAALDYLFLISEIASAFILKDAIDRITFSDFTDTLGPIAFELITFQDKSAIRAYAPLILNINNNPTVHGSVTGGTPILNINNNPTVHGTVTGDIIEISISGTEPVLL